MEADYLFTVKRPVLSSRATAIGGSASCCEMVWLGKEGLIERFTVKSMTP
uniref:Uncharacterized protein n=1 Tax=Pseudomonas putida TaxID=303 RepID=A0A6B7PX89_PSEPU|nr:hypothetical protein [Pseudomonas putida]